MSNDIHATLTEPPKNGLISDDLKKMLLPIAITLIISLTGSWFAAQSSQGQLTERVQTLKETVAANTQTIKQLSETQTQVAISMARISEAQSRIAADLKQLQDDQRINTRRLENR